MPDDVRLGEKGWKERYYRAKFNVDVNDVEFRRKYVEPSLLSIPPESMKQTTPLFSLTHLQSSDSICRGFGVGAAILLPGLLLLEMVLSLPLLPFRGRHGDHR